MTTITILKQTRPFLSAAMMIEDGGCGATFRTVDETIDSFD
jgi:hypothetical protein